MRFKLLLLAFCAVFFLAEAAILPIKEHIAEESKDEIPVAVIEVQEPDTVVQSLQVDTAIQTTFDEQENEFKDALSTEPAEVFTTEANKFQTDAEIDAVTPAAALLEETINNSQDEEQENLNLAATTEQNVDPAFRQNAESTTQQNFVQFIQNTPIGQFFTQLTGGQQQQQQQQQPGGSQVASDAPQTAPQAPGFLNPGVALTQAQQAVQNAAQSVVNTTTQAFQGLQQFASNIGTQFQSTISSLSGQNQQNQQNQQNLVQQDATTSVRPPGPIQAIVSNFVGGNGASTSRPGQAQGPFQGIISFFQGGQRPQNNNANPAQNQATGGQNSNNNNNAVVSNDQPSVDDKIENQEAEITNEVRNSEESLDSFEESQSGQDLIVVNDDASLVTEHAAAL